MPQYHFSIYGANVQKGMGISMKFDYAYYKDIYGGELTEREFCRFAETAADMIAAYLGVSRVGVGEECDSAAVLRALCCQAEYISACGGDPGKGSVIREALGDWSVTYGGGGSSGSSSSLSSAALAALRAGGYIGRWT